MHLHQEGVEIREFEKQTNPLEDFTYIESLEE